VLDHPSGFLKSKRIYIIFYAMLPTYERARLQGRSQASPVCASGKSNIWMRGDMKDLLNDFDKEDRSTGRKSHLLDTLSTSNVTWSEFGLSLDLYGGRQATGHLRFT
jgi:hypothetical protein